MSTPEASGPALTVGEVVDIIERLYPPATALSWDRVGLVVGDPARPVRRIHLAVDPTLEVVEEAVEAGADLLLCHHPLLLRGIHSVATTSAKGAVITRLISQDVALYCAHTSADVAAAGVSEALAASVGLEDIEPLSLEEGQPVGRVGTLAVPMTLEGLAEHLAQVLPSAPVGVRVAGPRGGIVRRVAVLGGSGDDRFDAVRASGVDVYITADLRHHPASEAREQARSTGGAQTPWLIDAGHWATEATWLPVAAEALRAGLGQRGTEVALHVSRVVTDPWSFVVLPGAARGAAASPEPADQSAVASAGTTGTMTATDHPRSPRR